LLTSNVAIYSSTDIFDCDVGHVKVIDEFPGQSKSTGLARVLALLPIILKIVELFYIAFQYNCIIAMFVPVK
jgi:hypothetical protein